MNCCHNGGLFCNKLYLGDKAYLGSALWQFEERSKQTTIIGTKGAATMEP
jgi:hypothetical protein